MGRNQAAQAHAEVLPRLGPFVHQPRLRRHPGQFLQDGGQGGGQLARLGSYRPLGGGHAQGVQQQVAGVAAVLRLHQAVDLGKVQHLLHQNGGLLRVLHCGRTSIGLM